MRPSIIILSFNSQESIGETIRRAKKISDDIQVVDSGSSDNTVAIVRESGVQLYHREFKNYGDQRNWAITNLPIRNPWQLHLDADENLTEELQMEILELPDNPGVDGYFVKRFLTFMGRVLRHNLAPTWHLRLFRSGGGKCEEREYDQHFYCSGSTAQLKGALIDDIKMSLRDWTSRHNRWADAEVKEILSRKSSGRIQASLAGDIVQRKRYYRSFYDRAPRFVRPLALFFFRYVIKGGFRDGIEGLIFCTLQTFWFRFLVDAKLLEAERQSGNVPLFSGREECST